MEENNMFKLPSKDDNKISRIYNGYGYAINYRTDTHTYLACIKKSDLKLKCKGRIVLHNGKIKETREHNHPPDDSLEERRKLNHAVKLAAQQNLGSFKQCYEKFCEDYPDAVTKQSYKSLNQTFRRWYVKYHPDTKRSPIRRKRPQSTLQNDEIQDLEHFISLQNQNHHLCTYTTKISDQIQTNRISFRMVKDGQYKHLVIYDHNLMDVIHDARQIIVHKMKSIVPKKCGTNLITIMFEKYEKALAGFWILLGSEEEFCYQILFRFIQIMFPNFNPKQAVVDYNVKIQNALKAAFQNIEIIPSFLNQVQTVFENAIRKNAAVKTNRSTNAEKHAVLRKFMALSMLPSDYMLPSYNRLVTECKTKYGTYFESFTDYYTKEWLDVWQPESLSVYRHKHLMKNFLECYQYRKNFEMGKELAPFTFIETIKNILTQTRTDLELLEHGEVLSYYLTPEDEEREKKIYKTWDRLDRDLITTNECLVICSNLLNEDFIDTLPDYVIEERTVNNDDDDSVVMIESVPQPQEEINHDSSADVSLE